MSKGFMSLILDSFDTLTWVEKTRVWTHCCRKWSSPSIRSHCRSPALLTPKVIVYMQLSTLEPIFPTCCWVWDPRPLELAKRETTVSCPHLLFAIFLVGLKEEDAGPCNFIANYKWNMFLLLEYSRTLTLATLEAKQEGAALFQPRLGNTIWDIEKCTLNCSVQQMKTFWFNWSTWSSPEVNE